MCEHTRVCMDACRVHTCVHVWAYMHVFCMCVFVYVCVVCVCVCVKPFAVSYSTINAQ